MMRTVSVAAAILCLWWTGAAQAADKAPCPAGLVCASKPSSVFDQVRALSPTATLGAAKDGTPEIDVTDKTYKYTIFFDDCDGRTACASLYFIVTFSAEDLADLAFVNKWNVNNRLARAMRYDDGSIALVYDVSTYGGLTIANFRDVVGWWDTTLDEFSDFYDAQDKARAGTDRPKA